MLTFCSRALQISPNWAAVTPAGKSMGGPASSPVSDTRRACTVCGSRLAASSASDTSMGTGLFLNILYLCEKGTFVCWNVGTKSRLAAGDLVET